MAQRHTQENWRQREKCEDFLSSRQHPQGNWRQREKCEDFLSSRQHPQENWRQRVDENLFGGGREWRRGQEWSRGQEWGRGSEWGRGGEWGREQECGRGRQWGRGGEWGREQECGRGRGRGSAVDRDFSGDCLIVLHPKRYEGEAPPLPPPTVLGSFSVDSKKNMLHDNSMMPVLSQKYIPDSEFMKVDMDLNRGRHRVTTFTGSPVRDFRNLLHWILKNQEKVRANSSDRLAADFVCNNAMLLQFMHAPYAGPQHMLAEWVVFAEYFKGTIYLSYGAVDNLEEDEVPEEEIHGIKEGETSLLSIYGHKFEQYVTGGDPDDVLHCDCQFMCVLQLYSNEMPVLFCSHIDAADPTRHEQDFKDMSSFVRLKARLESTTPNERRNRNYKKYKLNTWWTENKITGVPRLLVGKRNDDGVVHTLQMLQTDDLPGLAEGEWEPSVCINALDQFLNFVKRKMLAEPGVVHCFEKIAPALYKIRHSCDPNLEDILPNWYKQKLFNTQDDESKCSGGSS